MTKVRDHSSKRSHLEVNDLGVQFQKIPHKWHCSVDPNEVRLIDSHRGADQQKLMVCAIGGKKLWAK